jgi:uncharacterized surface protein with fasciclin (FAS1) repeats
MALVAAFAIFVVAGCGGSTPTDTAAMTDSSTPPAEQGVEVGGEMMLPSLNIVENASNAPNLTTLVKAVTAADLGETLSGPGPFTVFAPTNDAFAKVDPKTIDFLLDPKNVKDLASVLTYHVVPGALTSADLKDGDMLKTVEGDKLEIGVKGDQITVNGNTVETADVIDSNGVSFVIDGVLTPPAK